MSGSKSIEAHSKARLVIPVQFGTPINSVYLMDNVLSESVSVSPIYSLVDRAGVSLSVMMWPNGGMIGKPFQASKKTTVDSRKEL